MGTSFILAQEDENDRQAKNELKLNASNLIAFKFIDVSYESLLNEESSLGIGLLFNACGENYNFDDYSRDFSLTP